MGDRTLPSALQTGPCGLHGRFQGDRNSHTAPGKEQLCSHFLTKAAFLKTRIARISVSASHV